MLKHEEFEELSAAAAVGEATPEELARLSAHLAECPACREAYGEFLNIAAFEYASGRHDAELSQEEANQVFASTLFRERFFRRAADEGTVFSSSVQRPAIEVVSPRRKSLSRPLYQGLAAAGVAALLIAGAFEAGRQSRQTPAVVYSVPLPPPPMQPPAVFSASDYTRLKELSAKNGELEAALKSLRHEIGIQQQRLASAESDLTRGGGQSEQLRAERDSQSAIIQQLKKKLVDSDTLLAASRSEVSQLQAKAQSTAESAEVARVTALADASRVRDLTERLTAATDSLDRERQMLDANRDVRDLMAARNLHIVDVFDTDSKGKTRPAFGRVFFTEGKSLIFYAYDLSEAKFARVSYDFHVWGKREGPNQQPRNLGIFYSDDKAQRRWVFRLDDPTVLNEIDAVFVTVEPPGEKSGRPKGQQLMYAYLKAQPNHP